MGTQFWWFFDVVSVAVILIAVFLAGKKGFVKTSVMLLGCITALILGVSLSNVFAGSVYDTVIKQSNIKKLDKALTEVNMIQKTKVSIEGFGYNVKVNENELSKIFENGEDIIPELYKYVNNINGKKVDTEAGFNEKMTQSFADMTNTLVTDALGGNIGDASAEAVKGDMTSFAEMMRLIEAGSDGEDVSYRKAAEFMEEKFTGKASSEIIKILAFTVVALLIIIIAGFIEHRVNSNSEYGETMAISYHVLGAIFGIVEGIIILFVIAAAIRTLADLGNSEMIMFNDDTIKKTYVFKYIYNFAEKL